MLLLLGWTMRQLTSFGKIELPDLSPILPILGTIGLILIVLEGSLEVEFNRSKIGLVRKSFFGALLPLIALAFCLMFIFSHFGHFGLKESMINAIPFCMISSAIAIPSVQYLSSMHKEFVIYESSLSDILGVLMFNFLTLNALIDLYAVGNFLLQLVLMGVISLSATVLLSFLLSKIEHHVKFVPIILLVVLIYSISKIYHLPGLVFILLFGLAIGHVKEYCHFRWVEKFKPQYLIKEVKKFKELIVEGTFLVRASFFLVFGFQIETNDVLNLESLPWALIIVGCIVFFRIIQLLLSRLPLIPLLFVAPRGLITILLFLSIEPENVISMVNNAMVIQVILMTALIMMFGLLIAKKIPSQTSSDQH